MMEEEQHKKRTLNERFVDFADKISAGMGTPLNIIIWLVAVIAWFLLFALNPSLQNSSFMPTWFTSLPFNLPLNLMTTLAELFIGFLVAAAANRVEAANRKQIDHLESVEEDIDTIVAGMNKMLQVDHEENSKLMHSLYGLNEEQLRILNKQSAILEAQHAIIQALQAQGIEVKPAQIAQKAQPPKKS